ncbi:MAG TPA: hypothetical protein VFZ57_03630 [Thermoanaerobaculia bacterium]|nr:hypothetical protein [Thermoanaerobaculia bacterium]
MNAGRALVVVILGVLSASLALAQKAPPPSEAKKAPEAEKKAAPLPGEPGARAAGGLVVFIDPVTGKIRQPDAAEIGSLVPPPAAVTPLVEEPLVMKIGPGGAVGVVLDSRFESFMVVTKTPDGKLALDCVIGRKKADEAVSAGAKTAKKPDGKEAPHVQ